MYLKEIYNKTKKILKKDFIENPSLDARLLIMNALNLNQKEFLLELDNKKISLFEKIKLKILVNKRLKGLSIASIIKEKHFFDSKFIVNNNVLIPRPETELLIEIILERINNNSKISILDIGTGSGNIPIVLARRYPLAKIDSIDINKKSLKTAVKNIKINKISKEQVKILFRDIFKFHTLKKYDIIVSNPPYIKTNKLYGLLKKKAVSDPFISLDGGLDGLRFYRRIKDIAENNLNSNGWVFIEHGLGQKEDLKKIFGNEIYNIETYKDLAGIDRVMVLKKRGQ